MSNSSTINVALKIDDKGGVRVLQNIGKESTSTGKKGKKAFNEMDQSAKSFTGSAKMSANTMLKMGAGIVGILGLAKAWGSLKSAAYEYMDLASEQESAERKLGSVLKATGEAAGYNLDQLKAMASGLQDVTRIGDETTLAGMAILATFKQVRGEGFERATIAAMDMAEVMGTDLNSNILQIGKALQDPVKGLTALTRVGVTFTEGQKDTIKSLQASGDMMAAQNIILKELEGQFGGAAKAASQDFAGGLIQAQNALGDTKEEMGFVITKNQFFIELTHMATEEFKRWGEETKKNSGYLMDLAKDGVLMVVSSLKAGIETLRFFHNGWSGIKLVGQLAVQALAISLDALYPIIRSLLAPLDALYQGMVKLGVMDVNPFDAIGEGLATFKDSSAQVTKDVLADINKTNEKYDTISNTLQGYIDKIKKIPTAVAESAESEKAANNKRLDNLLEQGTAAEAVTDKELKALQEANQKKYAMDIALANQIGDDTWLIREEGLKKSLAQAEDAQTKMTQMEYDESQKRIKQQTDAHEKAIKEQERAYKQMMDNIQDYTADTFYDILDGQIRTWDDLFDTVLDSFKHMLAEMAAAKMASGIFSFVFGDSGGTAGGAVSSIFGGSSGGLVSTIAGKVLDPVKDYVWGGISGLFGGGEIEAGTGLVSAGGGSSLLGTIGSYAGWAAAAVSVMNHFTELNQESGRNNIYSAENGTTQIGNALNGNVFNDPITGWLSGAVNGNDSTRSSMAYLDAALANGNWDEIMKAGLASGIEASFTDPIINALAGNQIAKLFGFGQQSPRAGLFAGNHGSYPSSEYFYQTAFQDIGDPSGMANTLTSYFDTRFASLNQSTPNNINTLLRQNGDWGQSAWVDPTAFGGDNQAMVNSIEKQVFKSLADNLVQDLTGAGSGGKSIFGLAFFDDFATEGERAFDTFTRFAGIVNETDGFMVRITDQMNDFGVSAINAVGNIQLVDEILSGISDGLTAMGYSTLTTTLVGMTMEWELLNIALQAAHATTEELTQAEAARNTVMGAQLTGLSVDAIQGIVSGSGDLGASAQKAANNTLTAMFAENIYKTTIKDFNTQVGEVLDSDGGEAAALFVKSFDFTAINQQAEDFRINVLGLDSSLASVAEVAGGSTKEIEAFNASIDDIIASGSMSDYRYESMKLVEWYQAQKIVAEELGVSLNGLNQAYGVQKEAINQAEAAKVASFNAPIYDIIAQDTMSDHRYQAMKLVEWYAEQKKAAEELGVSLNGLNQAYGIQKEAIDQAEQDRIAAIAQAEQEALAETLSMIAAFDTSISDIISQNTLSDYQYKLLELDQWYAEQISTANDLGVALGDLNEAYGLQKDVIEKAEAGRLNAIDQAEQDALDQTLAMITSFNSSIQDIIDEGTLTGYQYSLLQLDQWYTEQTASANDLGIALDKLNQAYGIQKDVIEKVEQERLAAEADKLMIEAEAARDSAKSQYLSGLQNEVSILEDNLNSAKTSYLGLLGDELSAQEQLAGSMGNAIDSLHDYRRSLSTGAASPYGLGEQKDILSARMADLTAKAMMGDTIAMTDLIGVSGEYLEVSKQTQTTAEGYAADVVKTNITLKAVEDYAGDQLSETERQVRSLQSVVDGVNGVDDAVTDMATARGLYEAAQSALENNWYQDELDKLTEIEIGISGLKDAFYSAGSEVVGAGGTSGIIETTGVTSISVVGTPYDDIYPDWVKAAGVQSVFDYMESGAIGTDTKFMTPQGEVDTLANIKNNSAKLPGFALGGLIDGPASGYNVAATFHGPEVITPLADYMAADGYRGDFVAELRALRREMASLRKENEVQRKSIANSNIDIKKYTAILELWEKTGMPETRTA